MTNAVLEPSEFLYLLETLHASNVIGLGDERLFPTGEERQKRLAEGFKKLQEHGWLRPGDPPGRLDLDDALILMVAVAANPTAVILTARNISATERELLTHYLAEQVIVEASLTKEDKVLLATVPDRATAVDRISQVLDLGELTAAPFQFSIAEEDLLRLQQLAFAGYSEQAEADLAGRGLDKEQAHSLLSALQSTTTGGKVAVLNQRGGQVTAGRKITIFQSPAAAWLAVRGSQETPLLEVSTLQQNTLFEWISRFLASLAEAEEQVP